jgi:hypothetical protein
VPKHIWHLIVAQCQVSNFFSYIMEWTSYIPMKWWCPFCTKPTRLAGYFIVLAHWNNSVLVYMSPYSDTFSWFQANQYLLLLIDAVWTSLCSYLLMQYEPVFVLTHWCSMNQSLFLLIDAVWTSLCSYSLMQYEPVFALTHWCSMNQSLFFTYLCSMNQSLFFTHWCSMNQSLF